MAQYKVKFKIWGEYPSSYNGVCQVELSDDEVQQLIALMREHNSSDVDELDLEGNLPAIYEKISEACDDVAMEILEKDWLDSAIWNMGDSDFDERRLISHCQSAYGCPDFEEDEYDDDGEQYAAFDEWLRGFWKTATIKEQKDLLFNYMGFDEEELCEARCSFCEFYDIAIPQAIVKMAGVE